MLSDYGLASLLARVRRNIGIMFSGRIIITLFGIASITLNARALGPSLLGIFAMIQAYAAVCGRSVALDASFAILSLGGEATANRDEGRLRAVFIIGLVIDLASGIAASIVAILLIIGAGNLVGVSDQYQGLATVFALTLTIQFATAPGAILRLLDRFSVLTISEIADATLKAIAATALYISAAPLSEYVYSYAAITAISSLGRLTAVLFFLMPLQGRTLPLRNWPWWSSIRLGIGGALTRIVSVLRSYLVLFVVSLFYGPAGTGLYALAQRFTAPISFISDPIRVALYPEFSILKGRGEHSMVPLLIRKTLLITIPIAVGASIGSVLLGHVLLTSLAGPEYGAAYPILVGLTVAASLFLSFGIIGPLTILYAGMRMYVLSNYVAAAIWLIILPTALWAQGPAGAAWAEVLFMCIWAILNIAWLYRRRSLFT